MKERDVRGCKREGEGVCVTVCVCARHGGCDRPRAPQPCHLSSRKTTPDGNLCHGCWFKRGWTKTRRERRRRTDETCPRFMRGSERGARKDEMAFWMNIVLLIDQCGTSLILHMLSLSLFHSFAHRSKCIQLHFPPPLYLPPGNTVISVGVVKTAIKSLSVWFPMTVYRLWDGRLSCCVERRGCVSADNVMDSSKLKVFCGMECDLH